MLGGWLMADDLSQVLDDVIEAKLLDEWTFLVARVVSFSGTPRPTASLQPLPADYARGVAVPLAQIDGVRVCYPVGIRRPLIAGEFVHVHFSSRSLEPWEATGEECDPQDFRHHDLSDAFCAPLDSGASAPAIGSAPFAARVGDKVTLGSDLAAWIAGVIAACAAATPPIVIPPYSGTEAGVILTGSATVEIDD
jgi:hypothetical protein